MEETSENGGSMINLMAEEDGDLNNSTSNLVMNEEQNESIQADYATKNLTNFMLKSCFTSVLVLMDFNLMFIHFSSLWGANDLFSMKIMNQPIRADFAIIG